MLAEYTKIAIYFVSQDEVAMGTKAVQGILNFSLDLILLVFANISRNHLLVINHDPANIAMQSRLQGILNSNLTISQMNVSLLNDFSSDLHTLLASDTTIDSILTLGASTVPKVLSVLSTFERTFSFGTFDMNPVIYEAIDKGNMVFGIHQYQWLEAYFSGNS